MTNSDTPSSDPTNDAKQAQKLEWHRPQLRELDIADKTASGSYYQSSFEDSYYYTVS